ncbi:MAG: GatB/YqeY domain-containing protein [Candidatus Shapirobacteria bacterium]
MKSAGKELKIPEGMLRDKLKSDSVLALKNRDSARVDVLRFLISLIDKREMQLPPGGMTDKEEISVLRKELKNKQESREMFLKAGREDLVKQQDYEIEVVNEYLPQEMSESEVEKIVDEVVAEFGGNFGLVMKNVMIKVAGRAGGEMISKMVKERTKSL